MLGLAQSRSKCVYGIEPACHNAMAKSFVIRLRETLNHNSHHPPTTRPSTPLTVPQATCGEIHFDPFRADWIYGITITMQLLLHWEKCFCCSEKKKMQRDGFGATGEQSMPVLLTFCLDCNDIRALYWIKQKRGSLGHRDVLSHQHKELLNTVQIAHIILSDYAALTKRNDNLIECICIVESF